MARFGNVGIDEDGDKIKISIYYTENNVELSKFDKINEDRAQRISDKLIALLEDKNRKARRIAKLQAQIAALQAELEAVQNS